MISENILREIKASFRQAMNADLSNSMRAHGLNYRMNFGVPSPRIKLIAERFEPGVELASYLWNEDVRESKMLATYLFPKEEMTRELAIEWVQSIRYPEIADQVSMNLFSRLSFAGELALDWMNSDSNMIAYTGFRLQMRLLLQNGISDDAVLQQIIEATKKGVVSDVNYIAAVAISILEQLQENEHFAKIIRSEFADWQHSDDSLQNAVYQRLTFWDNE
ncbi:MAG: DNA alkylation repair protein [Bacteroidales bacterium]